MKTTMKKVLASVSALAMSAVIVAPSMSAFAAKQGKIEISSNGNVNVESKTFKAYKLFDLVKTEIEKEENGQKTYTYTYKYTVTDEWYPFFAKQYNSGKTTGTIPETLTGSDSEQEAAKQAITDWLNELGVAAGETGPANESKAVRDLAKALQEELKKGTYEGTTIKEENPNKDDKIEATLPEGYYLIVDTTENLNESAKSAPILTTVESDENGASGTVDKTNPVTVKADAPKIEKKIWEDGLADPANKGTDRKGEVDDWELIDANTAGIGETVHYQLDATIPDTNRYDKYTYVITDKLSDGLNFNFEFEEEEVTPSKYQKVKAESIDITFGSCTPGTPPCEKHTAVRWTAYFDEDENQLKIVFNADDMKSLGDEWKHAGEKIVVKYTATVNDNAIIGSNGNPNEVDLTYSNDPSNSGKGYKEDEPTEPDGPSSKSEKDKVITYLTEICVEKKDEKGNILTGAEFTITNIDGTPVAKLKRVEEITYYKVKENGDKEKISKEAFDGFQPDGTWVKTEEITSYIYVPDPDSNSPVTAEVDAQGRLVFRGLKAGTYKIEETKAPDGYNGLTDTITVTVECYDADEYSKEGNNNTLITGQKVDGKNDTAVWVASAKFTDSQEPIDINGGNIVIEVINHKGSLFPSTGGIGTTIFYIVGIAMLVGAGSLVIVKRKVSES